MEQRVDIRLFWGKEAQVQKFCGKSCIGYSTQKMERRPVRLGHRKQRQSDCRVVDALVPEKLCILIHCNLLLSLWFICMYMRHTHMCVCVCMYTQRHYCCLFVFLLHLIKVCLPQVTVSSMRAGTSKVRQISSLFYFCYLSKHLKLLDYH